MTGRILYVCLIVCLLCTAATAQRKAVSGAEVTGTFRNIDEGLGEFEFKILALGKGKLKVVFFGALKLGPDGEARGNTAYAEGTALIEGDTAIFTPDMQEAEQCTIEIKFTKPGRISVEQTGAGDCGYGSIISASGEYKKVSNAKPRFAPPE